jgi:4-hydroxybenzoate polyprenyltransferase
VTRHATARGFDWGVLRVLHPFPSFLVATVTVALVPFADPHASPALYVVLGLGMLCYQFSLGVANDVVDAADDAATKPWKPVARGAISRRAATLLAAALAGAGLLATSGLELVPWLIGAAGLACGLAYDVQFKRTPLSFVPWAIAFPLIPAWVYTAADAWDQLLWWAFPLGGLLAVALYFANQAPGAEAERTMGVRGLSQAVGERRSRAIAVALFGIAASAAVVVLLFVALPQAALTAIAGAVAFLLAPRATAYFGRDGLFGVLAAGAAALAVVFLSAA